MVGDSVDYLCVYDNRSKGDQVWYEDANLVALTEDIKRRLLAKWNLSEDKLHDQRIFVWLLNKPVAKCI